MKVVMIGGGAGGASAAARLRRNDENAEIIIFERTGYIAHANCGEPYYIGGVIEEREKLTVQTPKGFKERFNVDVRVKSEVTAIDRDAKKVHVKNLETGEEYDESYEQADPFPRCQGGRATTLPAPMTSASSRCAPSRTRSLSPTSSSRSSRKPQSSSVAASSALRLPRT